MVPPCILKLRGAVAQKLLGNSWLLNAPLEWRLFTDNVLYRIFKKFKCKVCGSLDFYYGKILGKYSEKLYNVPWTFQGDQRTFPVSSDCCRRFKSFFLVTLSSKEIICRGQMSKMSNRASLAELDLGHPLAYPASSLALQLFPGFWGCFWARGQHCWTTIGQ